MGRTKRETIKKMKETVMEEATAFVGQKGHDEKTMVMNLETGDCYSYSLPPVNALKAAYIANMMRGVGRISDSELIVYYSASQEFKELDSKIELAANNTMLRLGALYTYANKSGKECLESIIKNTMIKATYKRYF